MEAGRQTMRAALAEGVRRYETTHANCPQCGIGTLSPATVDETLRVGADAVEVTVEANVCGYCGEHWFDPPAQAVIDTAIWRLRDGDLSHHTHIGEVYRAS